MTCAAVKWMPGSSPGMTVFVWCVSVSVHRWPRNHGPADRRLLCRRRAADDARRRARAADRQARDRRGNREPAARSLRRPHPGGAGGGGHERAAARQFRRRRLRRLFRRSEIRRRDPPARHRPRRRRPSARPPGQARRSHPHLHRRRDAGGRWRRPRPGHRDDAGGLPPRRTRGRHPSGHQARRQPPQSRRGRARRRRDPGPWAAPATAGCRARRLHRPDPALRAAAVARRRILDRRRLVEPGAPLADGQVYDSNRHTLARCWRSSARPSPISASCPIGARSFACPWRSRPSSTIC